MYYYYLFYNDRIISYITILNFALVNVVLRSLHIKTYRSSSLFRLLIYHSSLNATEPNELVLIFGVMSAAVLINTSIHTYVKISFEKNPKK